MPHLSSSSPVRDDVLTVSPQSFSPSLESAKTGRVGWYDEMAFHCFMYNGGRWCLQWHDHVITR